MSPNLTTASNLKKNCIILGNCQATALRKILSSVNAFFLQYNIINTPPVHIMTEVDILTLSNQIKHCDLLITQVISTIYKGSIGQKINDALSFLPIKSCKIFIPNLYFKGYNPELFYIKSEGITVNDTFDYHNEIIFQAYVNNHGVKDTINLLEKIEITNLDQILEENFYEAEKRETELDIKISPFLKEHFKTTKLFHTFNHPSNSILFFICDSILNRIGISELLKPLPEILCNTCYPVLNSVRILGFYTFKGSDNFATVRGQEYSIEDLILKYFDWYDNNRDIVLENRDYSFINYTSHYKAILPSPSDFEVESLHRTVNHLNPWHQKIILTTDIIIDGPWDPIEQASLIFKEIQLDMSEKIVYDVGANAGGISFEFAKKGAHVTAFEINKKSLQQIYLYLKCNPNISIKVKEESIFNLHNQPDCDLLLLLGLVYHFRHPQLFLDYAAQLKFKYCVISTNTFEHDELILKNRAKKWKKDYLMGWEADKKVFVKMLEAAGFQNIKYIYTPKKTFTNNSYFFCSKGKESNNNILEHISALSKLQNWWS